MTNPYEPTTKQLLEAADVLYGPIPSELEEMSDAELLADLGVDLEAE